MDYQSMSARELQQACRDRGLPTARDKDTMVARLTEAVPDTSNAEVPEADAQVPVANPDDEVIDLASLVPVVPAVHRQEFPAHDGALDDAEHAANRAATIASAHDHGYTTMGDAYRVATVDGMHLYEVHLRRGLA